MEKRQGESQGEDEIEEVHEDILGEKEINIVGSIVVGEFGAYDTGDKYHIVEWTDTPKTGTYNGLIVMSLH